MAGSSGKKGKALLVEVVTQLRAIDPRIVFFDSQEIEDLELATAQAVRDVFGSGSSEYDEFEQFKMFAGPISRGDSRTEKQSRFEMGIPKVIARLEELLDLMDRVDPAPVVPVRELTSDDLVEVVEPAAKDPARAEGPPSEPAAKPEPKPEPEPEPKLSPPVPQRQKKPASQPSSQGKPASAPSQPGKVLIISGASEEIVSPVEQLLRRLGIFTELPGKDPAALAMENLASVDHVAFTLLILAGGQKGGLSGLTSAIGIGKSNHELAYKLGFFIGRLGPGAVAVLFDGDRPADLPEQLFGVRYIQYQKEGGWQIGLLKLLKANGFFIDANLLFE